MKNRVEDAEMDAWFLLQALPERRRLIAWWNAKSAAEQARLLEEPRPPPATPSHAEADSGRLMT